MHAHVVLFLNHFGMFETMLTAFTCRSRRIAIPNSLAKSPARPCRTIEYSKNPVRISNASGFRAACGNVSLQLGGGCRR